MRILMLPDYRAANPYQAELASALSRRGAEVVFPSPGPAPRFAVLDAAHSVGLPELVVHLHWPLSYVRKGPLFLRISRALRLLAEIAGCRLGGASVFWTVHNLEPHDSAQPKLDRWLGRAIAALCTRLIAHSESAKQAIVRELRIDAGRISVIPHGHYIDSYPKGSSRDAARQELGLTPGGMMFLMFGLVRRYKGVDELLEAWAEHSASRPDDRLYIVGRALHPEFGLELEQRLAGQRTIRFINGFVSEHEVSRWFAASDVAVLPYRQVFTSGTAVLAASFGVPVIAPRLAGLEDAVGDADDLLYPPGSRAGLVGALSRAHVIDRATLGRRAQAAVRLADWDGIARLTLDAYGAGRS